MQTGTEATGIARVWGNKGGVGMMFVSVYGSRSCVNSSWVYDFVCRMFESFFLQYVSDPLCFDPFSNFSSCDPHDSIRGWWFS